MHNIHMYYFNIKSTKYFSLSPLFFYLLQCICIFKIYIKLNDIIFDIIFFLFQQSIFSNNNNMENKTYKMCVFPPMKVVRSLILIPIC